MTSELALEVATLVILRCTACDHTRPVHDRLKGQKVKCPNCGASTVPGVHTSAAEVRDQTLKQTPLTLAALMKQHVGQPIAINCDEPATLKPAELVAVGSDYFTVLDGVVAHHFPFRAVLCVQQRPATSAPVLVVHVFHLVVYQGSIGLEFGL